MIMRLLYSLLLALALPLIVLRLWWRGRRQAGYRKNIGERFGIYRQPRGDGAIWIHAVSVGETRAAEPLVKALRARYPERPILLSGMTPTGRETATALFGSFATVVYLPYDLPGLQRSLINHFQPAVLLIMETEIWPNLIEACRQTGVPALLVNARLSEKSRGAYSRVAPLRALAAQAFGSLERVGAQSAADAERLKSVGAKDIVVTGNIKFDMTPDSVGAARGKAWREATGKTHVLLAASTREGEEAMLLAAFQKAFDADFRQSVLLVIVPRHPQRFDEVSTLIERTPLRTARRSVSEQVPDDCEVWLGDSMGEMAAYYSLADLAIVGGSFLPLGGQNLIEAAALGVPVVMGPSTFNFADAAANAREVGAMKQVGDADEAMTVCRQLLADERGLETMSAAAREFASTHRGATEKTMGLVAPLLSGK